MKKLVLLFATAIMLVTLNSSCGGVKTSTTGLDNQSFLEFNGTPSKYDGGVDVNVDDKLNFKAKVVKYKANKISTTVYAIKPGKHIISVNYNGALLYKQQLFLSNQETRKIKLP